MTRFLTPQQAAQALGIEENTLRNWRHLGQGPAFYKIGRRVNYAENDLQAFLQQCRVEQEAASK